MAKTCIDIPTYTRDDGTIVHAHQRCYNDIGGTTGYKNQKLKGALLREVPQEDDVNPRGDSLTSDERYTLEDYTNTDYIYAHRQLLKVKEENRDRQAKWLIKNMDSVLEKLPVFKGTVFRGVRQTKEGRHRWYANNVGKTFKWKTYVSASESKDMASSFTSHYDKALAKEGLVFEIKSESGCDISWFSAHPNEKEILFPRDLFFEISGYKTETQNDGSGNTRLVHLISLIEKRKP